MHAAPYGFKVSHPRSPKPASDRSAARFHSVFRTNSTISCLDCMLFVGKGAIGPPNYLPVQATTHSVGGKCPKCHRTPLCSSKSVTSLSPLALRWNGSDSRSLICTRVDMQRLLCRQHLHLQHTNMSDPRRRELYGFAHLQPSIRVFPSFFFSITLL